VHALQHECSRLSPYDRLIDDIRVMLNEATHYLVKAALHQSLDQVWMENSHIFIQSIVLADQDILV
jgi:hypothetical protein